MPGDRYGDEHDFDDIVNISIHDMTLRELLLFFSLYLCSTPADIYSLVTAQPNPTVWFKSCLEFDCTNLVSILSFDSKALKYLL